jgi:drug/metabolite transporter (DMT)-like permease
VRYGAPAVSAPSTPTVVPTPRAFSGADLVLLLVIIIWGTNYTVVKGALEAIPPLAFMSLRFALASLAMALVLLWREGWVALPRATLLKLGGLGLVGHTVYQVCFVLGVAHTTAANSGMLTAGTPAITALLGAVLGVERLRRPMVLGLVLAVPGVLLIVMARGPGLEASTRVGDLLILGASLCWALYTVGLRWLGPGLSALRVTALSMLSGAPGVILMGLPEVLTLRGASLPASAWTGMVYSALIPLVLAYVVWSHSVQTVGSGRTGLYNSGTPVVAALTAWSVRGERPTWLQAVGVLLVISGVLLGRKR